MKETTEPIVVFLAEEDEIIPNASTKRLKEFLKKDDRIINLPAQGHNGINDNETYRQALADILSISR